DRASEVRIVGAGTDLMLSLEGREGEVDAGHANMPGGEVYYCPVEDATEGGIDFSEFPAFQEPDEIEGVRMLYRGGGSSRPRRRVGKTCSSKRSTATKVLGFSASSGSGATPASSAT